jgi:hypothetical protein
MIGHYANFTNCDVMKVLESKRVDGVAGYLTDSEVCMVVQAHLHSSLIME